MSRDGDTSVVFRQVNEQILRISTAFGLTNGERLQIICECARPDCAEPIDLTMDEYHNVRSLPIRFAIKPDHPFPQGGPPESRNTRFWVVVDPLAEPSEAATGT